MVMPQESGFVGYADDVTALVATRFIDQDQIKLNMVMRLVNNWMTLTKKSIPIVIPVRVGDEAVASNPAVLKYLGMMIDSKLSFSERIRRTVDKAVKGVMSFTRLMANIGGPK